MKWQKYIDRLSSDILQSFYRLFFSLLLLLKLRYFFTHSWWRCLSIDVCLQSLRTIRTCHLIFIIKQTSDILITIKSNQIKSNNLCFSRNLKDNYTNLLIFLFFSVLHFIRQMFKCFKKQQQKKKWRLFDRRRRRKEIAYICNSR